MKLCVFPNDSINSYYKKGEIKDRYFNPGNLFDEIHVISLFNSDEKEENVKAVAGDAKLKIHVMGQVNLLNKNSKKNKVIKLIKEIQPSIIRAFDPLLQGWVAVKAAKELNIPVVISLHGEYDAFRDMVKKQNYKQYLKLLYTSKFVEPFVLKNADRVICVYKVILPYAEKNGAKKIDLIYNKVDLSRFSKPLKKNDRKTPLVITVGRLIKQKNHEILIRAISDLNANLLIIGDGDEYNGLLNLVKNLDLENKITFQRSIPHSEIHKWYQSADVFALAMRTNLESLPIPILEAMACGLPIIIPKPVSTELYDDLGDGVLLVDNNPKSFKDALKKVIEDNTLREDLSKKVLEKIRDFDGKIMEQKECKLYEQLFNK